jgi:hypothetical protein
VVIGFDAARRQGMKTILLDYDGEPAKLLEDEKGIIHEAKVYRDGKWVDANWADLYCKAKIATPYSWRGAK